jgi:putative flippase GtrA
MNHTLSNIQEYPKQTNSFFRFILVGIINTLVGLSTILTFLHVLDLPYYISTFAGNSIGALVSYLLNRCYTFHSTKSIQKSGPLFIVVVAVSYFSAYSIGDRFGSEIGHVHLSFIFLNSENIAVLIGTGLYTIINYFGQKYFVFMEKM